MALLRKQPQKVRALVEKVLQMLDDVAPPEDECERACEAAASFLSALQGRAEVVQERRDAKKPTRKRTRGEQKQQANLAATASPPTVWNFLTVRCRAT